MLITDLLDCGIKIGTNNTQDETEISGLTEDSRLVKDGYLFAAVRGSNVDGTAYIQEAISNGARAILTYPDVEVKDGGIAVIKCERPRLVLGHIASKYFGRQPDKIAAITGTNGKTSVADFTRQIWHYLGEKSASVGTMGIFKAVDEEEPCTISLTTPGVVDVNKLIAGLAGDGITHLAVEASSHGIEQDRLAGLNINIGAFTNFSREHLDYHGTMEEYFNAKIKLFTEVMDRNSSVVINADIDEYQKIKDICLQHGHNIIDYGCKARSISLKGCDAVPEGISLKFSVEGKDKQITLPLFGKFQASNLLCALGIVKATHSEKIYEACEVLTNLRPVRGRMEKVAGAKNGAMIFVDYAHTPDALQKALMALREHTGGKGKLIVVFGCGGDRDRGKRPEMGKIAVSNADVVIITDDNPRSENPQEIRNDIMEACKGAREVPDRRGAIETAIEELQEDDILLIAGKGHESVQIVGNEELEFDDAEISRKIVGV